MRVKELLEKLQEFDEDDYIYIQDDYFGPIPVNDIEMSNGRILIKR